MDAISLCAYPLFSGLFSMQDRWELLLAVRRYSRYDEGDVAGGKMGALGDLRPPTRTTNFTFSLAGWLLYPFPDIYPL